jgi:hypothetical protein
MNQLMALLVQRTVQLVASAKAPPLPNAEFLCVRSPKLGNKWVVLTIGEFMSGQSKAFAEIEQNTA